MLLGTGGTINVVSIKACVVYEPETGIIKHIHHSITLEGGSPTPDEQVEHKALEIAAKRHPDPGRLRTLPIPNESLDPNRRYRVDHESRSLIEQE
jgi:hypothetical protein